LDEGQAYLPMISALSQCGEAQHNEVAGRTRSWSEAWVANDPASRVHRFDSGRRL
jgi:hypothetical protein